MNRRDFFTVTVCSVAAICHAENAPLRKIEDAYETIFTVQRHFFPKGLEMPDADSFGASDYFKEAINHKSFDPDIRELLFKGAVKLQELAGGKFESLSFQKREDLLREFEKDEYGGYWLVQLMNITLEALLGDPIYGGNKNEAGWKSFTLKSGIPRPKERYCGV
ncbi:MAG: gluconate 2-dehydrogenase subunit 3 family protein [Hydrogenimonas sp.]|nr:gluconate 2-dehydrogenase subunit 3 family protein [Hydrogenimonas sp.]